MSLKAVRETLGPPSSRERKVLECAGINCVGEKFPQEAVTKLVFRGPETGVDMCVFVAEDKVICTVQYVVLE
jgi:hypothetical protein